RMKFDDNKTANTIFEGEKKLKLVTHCKNSRKYEQYYIQEYLLYRVYSLLTPLSFRVRMANITYIDSRKKTKPVTKACFFIENFKQMAKRNNAGIAKVESIKVYQADREVSILVAVFQFLIGNTDWSNNFGHNIKWLLMGDKKKYYPVPFDFDQAGMVHTHYAKPDRILRIKSVRE
ncbi:MAG: hypothetical protein GY940_47030, partial [bacterium]|nr:hypothetical protein [bacterium]